MDYLSKYLRSSLLSNEDLDGYDYAYDITGNFYECNAVKDCPVGFGYCCEKPVTTYQLTPDNSNVNATKSLKICMQEAVHCWTQEKYTNSVYVTMAVIGFVILAIIVFIFAMHIKNRSLAKEI